MFCLELASSESSGNTQMQVTSVSIEYFGFIVVRQAHASIFGFWRASMSMSAICLCRRNRKKHQHLCWMSFAFAYGSRLVSRKFAIVGVERMMVHGSRAIWIGYNCWVFDFMYVVKATANSLHALHGGLPLAHQQFLYDNLTVTTSAVRGSRNMPFAIDIWRNNNEKKNAFQMSNRPFRYTPMKHVLSIMWSESESSAILFPISSGESCVVRLLLHYHLNSKLNEIRTGFFWVISRSIH